MSNTVAVPERPGMAFSRSAPTALVVGGGIGGLTAGFRLQQAGFQVEVFEAASSVGGRMSTLEKQGYRIDLAASVFPTGYHRMLPLIDDAGLSGEIEPTSDLVGILREGQVYRTRSHAKLDALFSGLLSPGAKLNMLKAAIDAFRAAKQLSWYDLGEAAALDKESAADYARRRLGKEVLDYIVDPACRAVCLTSPERVSTVDFLFAISNVLGGRFFNSRTGANFLPNGLARQLKVSLQTRVLSVQEATSGVEVCFERRGATSESRHFDVCVIAVPVPVMLDIYPSAPPLVREVLGDIEYATAIGVHLGLRRAPAEEPAIMIQIPSRSHADLSAVILDHNKAPGRAPTGRGLLTSYWQHGWGQKQWDRDDQSIVDDAVYTLKKTLPGLVDTDIELSHIQRWKYGPLMPKLGSYRNLAKLRGLDRATSRVQLVGDYFSSSSTYASLCSGETAASHLVAQFSQELIDG